MISEVIDKVLQEVKSIDKLCAPSQEAADDLSLILKNLYDSSVQISRKKVGPLDKLAVTGLDDETIWEEIQTRNKPLLRYLTKLVTRLKKKVQAAELLEVSSEEDEEMDVDATDFVEIGDGEGEDENESVGEDEDDEEEEENDSEGAFDSEDDEGDFDETRDDFVGSESEQEDAESEGDELVGDSEDDMEAWLDREDELEMNRTAREERRNKKADKKQTADSDDEEEPEEADEMAFVQQHMYEDDGGGDDSDGDEAGNADYKFGDFFVADKTERRAKARAAGKVVKCKEEATLKFASKKKSASKKSKQQQSHSDDGSNNEEGSEDEGSFGGDSNGEEEDEGEDWNEEEEEEDEEEEDSAPAASTKSSGKATATQQRNQALSSQIASLEEELMSAKPWELRGEVKAADRPENSFLELHADIERTSKPAPVVTQ
eukprot:gene19834-22544_t